MVILGIIKVAEGFDFGGDAAAAPGFFQRLLEGVECTTRLDRLPRRHRVDGGTIGRTDVIALPHALGWIMLFEKDLQQVAEGDNRWIEDDLDDFCVTGETGCGLVIAGVGRDAARIADGGDMDAGDLPEQPLGTPETSHAEIGDLQTVRIGALEGATVDEMMLRRLHSVRPARQGAIRRRHDGLLPEHVDQVHDYLLLAARAPQTLPPKGLRNNLVPPARILSSHMPGARIRSVDRTDASRL